MYKILSILLLLLSFISCKKKDILKGKNKLSENFEIINSFDDLFKNDKWNYSQKTETNSSIQIDTLIPHGGNHCLKITAAKGKISKSDIANNTLSFLEHETVKISLWAFLSGSPNFSYLYLLDIEENTAIGASPGLRIAIDNKGYLIVDRSKFGESTLHQNDGIKTKFPLNKWVKLEIEINLQQKKKGFIQLWQNETLIINTSKIQTLPKDKLYFIQGTKGMYQSIQVGITAMSSEQDITLYLDDFNIYKKN